MHFRELPVDILHLLPEFMHWPDAFALAWTSARVRTAVYQTMKSTSAAIWYERLLKSGFGRSLLHRGQTWFSLAEGLAYHAQRCGICGAALRAQIDGKMAKNAQVLSREEARADTDIVIVPGLAVGSWRDSRSPWKFHAPLERTGHVAVFADSAHYGRARLSLPLIARLYGLAGDQAAQLARDVDARIETPLSDLWVEARSARLMNHVVLSSRLATSKPVTRFGHYTDPELVTFYYYSPPRDGVNLSTVEPLVTNSTGVTVLDFMLSHTDWTRSPAEAGLLEREQLPFAGLSYEDGVMYGLSGREVKADYVRQEDFNRQW